MTEWEPNASIRVLEHLLLMALAICLPLLFCVTSRALQGVSVLHRSHGNELR